MVQEQESKRESTRHGQLLLVTHTTRSKRRRTGAFGELISRSSVFASVHSSPTGQTDAVHFCTCKMSWSKRPYSTVMFAVTAGFAGAGLAPVAAVAALVVDAVAAGVDGLDAVAGAAAAFFFAAADAAGAGDAVVARTVGDAFGDLVFVALFFFALLTADDSGVLSSSSSLVTWRLAPPLASLSDALVFAASAAAAEKYARRRPSQNGIVQCSLAAVAHSRAWYLTSPLSCSQCEQLRAPPHDTLCLNTRRTSSHLVTWHTPDVSVQVAACESSFFANSIFSSCCSFLLPVAGDAVVAALAALVADGVVVAVVTTVAAATGAFGSGLTAPTAGAGTDAVVLLSLAVDSPTGDLVVCASVGRCTAAAIVVGALVSTDGAAIGALLASDAAGAAVVATAGAATAATGCGSLLTAAAAGAWCTRPRASVSAEHKTDRDRD